ncbi:MAG: hypothetical protein U0414_40725 [Polyangiaceae bacterium]
MSMPDGMVAWPTLLDSAQAYQVHGLRAIANAVGTSLPTTLRQLLERFVRSAQPVEPVWVSPDAKEEDIQKFDAFTLTWLDRAAGTPRCATRFSVEIRGYTHNRETADDPRLPVVVPATPTGLVSLHSPLGTDRTYWVRVQAQNAASAALGDPSETATLMVTLDMEDWVKPNESTTPGDPWIDWPVYDDDDDDDD